MNETAALKFFLTKPHPCSYLANREASTIFADPAHPVTPEIYNSLTEHGFRRSGQHLYRPHCSQCQACIPIRVPVARFRYSRQQRRTWSANQDLQIEITEDINSGEHYRLYERYISGRHGDGDMYPPTREQYEAFLGIPPFDRDAGITHYVEFRLNRRLLGVAVTDILPAGLSAIYTFYDPDEAHRSLGVFSVLFQVEMARRLSLPCLYLGYWIRECRKMAYKSNYHPHEIYRDNRWVLVDG